MESSFIGIFVVCFIASITPGPDILLVLRYGLHFGLRHSVCAFLGIASGWAIYLCAIYFGLLAFLDSTLAQMVLSFLGGAYLCYVSFCIIKSNATQKGEQAQKHLQAQINALDSKSLDFVRASAFSSYIKGLVINLSNPKAVIFFTTIIVPFMGGEILLAIVMVFASLCVPFCLVIVLAHFASKVITARVFIWIDRICAVVFGLFGLFLFYNGCLLMLEL